MRTKQSILSIGTALIVVLLAGCSSAPQSLNEDYMKTAAETRKDVDSMFLRTGGDYSKLTPEEHDRYVKYFAGKEEPAKAAWDRKKSGQLPTSTSEIQR